MKTCKYNFFVTYGNRTICFNALSGKVFSVNEKEYSFIQRALASPDKTTKLGSFLYQNQFIVEDEFDEVNYILLHNRTEVFNKTFHLIINPTLECNFNCWYCYEKHSKGHISDETLQNIIKFITQRVEKKEITGLDLNWFGGEPLLYFKKVILPISLFAKDLMETNHLSFRNGITTNGYLITDQMIEQFKLIDLTSFQITLDGTEEFHNETRNQRGTPSFKKIIDNITKICRAIDTARIRVRINYTNEILQEDFSRIFNEFPSDIRKKITLDYQRVWQTTSEIANAKNKNPDILSKIKLAREMGFTCGLNSQYSLGKFHQCYADKYYYAHINFNGKVYKCTARDYSDKYVCGILLNSGEIQWKPGILERMHAKANFENEKCLSCKLLPLCLGPCHQKYLEYKKKEIPTFCIDEYKELELNQFIEEYYLNVKEAHKQKTCAIQPPSLSNEDRINQSK